MKKILLTFFIPAFLLAGNTLVVDENLSPIAGAYDILYFHDSLCYWEDELLGEENKTNWIYRFGRLGELFLWNSLNTMISIGQHEFFGHGYRLRNAGAFGIKYKIGTRGGYTRPPKNFFVNKETAVAIAAGGLEAEAILAHQMKKEWMQKRCIDGRQASLYAQAAHSLFWYTLGTVLSKNEPSEGNDIILYLRGLHKLYPDYDISIHDVVDLTWFTWLDPMTFFAYYSMWHYISKGVPWRYPMIKISSRVEYLPNMRLGYGLYGPEIYFENYFLVGKSPFYLYIKRGDQVVGVGIEYDHLLPWQDLSFGIRLDGWRHTEEREVLHDGMPSEKVGFAGSLICRTNIAASLGLFVEAGAKTDGYLPGYPLKQGVVLRFGLRLN